MMISSQPSAQPVASLHSGTETGIKRIVPHRGSASGSDPPRSSPEAEPCLLKKTPTERKYTSYPQAARRDPGYWPVISLLATTETSFVEIETPHGRSAIHMQHVEPAGAIVNCSRARAKQSTIDEAPSLPKHLICPCGRKCKDSGYRTALFQWA